MDAVGPVAHIDVIVIRNADGINWIRKSKARDQILSDDVKNSADIRMRNAFPIAFDHGISGRGWRLWARACGASANQARASGMKNKARRKGERFIEFRAIGVVVFD